MYGTYSADLFITPNEGKSIDSNHPIFEDLKENKDVISVSKIIEETALIKHENLWVTAKIKGVDTSIYSPSFFSKSLIPDAGFIGKGCLFDFFNDLIFLSFCNAFLCLFIF